MRFPDDTFAGSVLLLMYVNNNRRAMAQDYFREVVFGGIGK